ncbi:MAG: 2Fe-2S ferredoxin [endosymbiont of Galathealinum brachiosum]|uniref:2Fe-2S ferredoxin n=1 Tax=endosymbiont of Galathealinum brachiosum TaxID=2200906 RepID=A0A370DFF4_9GAMM|nr:MAG: 2Fe-2S ferredoxin [endosymbiont of Galathealinum brachiosum]
MSYYQHHIFFCTNQREDGRRCCEQAGASKLRAYAKAKIKSLGMSGKGRIRVNTAGCLDRCGQGPVIVVYPDETWYRYENEKDIDEIIEQHLVNNQQVKRLMVD